MSVRKYFSANFSSPSSGEDEDFYSDYDDEEICSYDRSSAGSIPWAEDAIKKNKEEWERIESYFEDESNDNLPFEDKDLCREILEWKKFFPPKKKNIVNEDIKKDNSNLTASNKKGLNDSNKKDLSVSKKNEDMTHRYTNFVKSSTITLENFKSSNKKQQEFKNMDFQNIKALNKSFTKDLRISSIPKRTIKPITFVNSSSHIQNFQPQAVPIQMMQRQCPLPHQLFPIQSAKYLLEKYPNSIVTVEKQLSPHSASFSRFRPSYDILKHLNTKTIPTTNRTYQFQSRYDTLLTSKRNQKNQVILPALKGVNSNGMSATVIVHGSNLRSISAFNHNHYEHQQSRTINNISGIAYLPELRASNK